MRQNYQLYLTTIIVAAIATSCRSYSYFSSPNDVLKQEAKVSLTDGTEKKGKITILFETGQQADKFITLRTDSGEEKIPIERVQSYQVGKQYYLLKKIDFDDNGQPSFLFVKRMTDANSRLNMYELYRSKNHTSDGADLYLYFVSFQSQDRFEAWSISDKHFFPRFDEKMSTLLKDCPSLADKIKQKEKGYFLSPMAITGKRLEVFTRIVKEYNECPQ